MEKMFNIIKPWGTKTESHNEMSSPHTRESMSKIKLLSRFDSQHPTWTLNPTRAASFEKSLE